MEKVAEGISPLALLQIEKAVGHCTRNLTHVDDKIKVVLKTVTDQDNSMAKTLQRLDDKEGSLYKTQIQMSSNIEKANTNMQQILRQTFQEFTEHEDRVQNALATGISDSMQSHSETLLAQVNDTESLIQLAVAQQTTEMQKLFYQLDCNESRVEVAVSKKVSDVSEEMKEVRKCLQSVNDNIKTSGDALHKALGEQMSTAFTAMRKDDSREVLQASYEPGQDLQPVLNEIASTERRVQLAVAQQIGEVRRSVQQLIDQKQEATEAFQQLGVVENEPSLTGLVSRHVDEIHKTLQRFLDQKDSSESQLQLAVSSQIQDIATAVQKLLLEKDCRDTARDTGNSLEAAFVQQLEDVKMCVKCQVDAALDQVLKGVADLLTRSQMAMQEECNGQDQVSSMHAG